MRRARKVRGLTALMVAAICAVALALLGITSVAFPRERGGRSVEAESARDHCVCASRPCAVPGTNSRDAEIFAPGQSCVRKIRLRSADHSHHHAAVSRIHAWPGGRAGAGVLPRLRRACGEGRFRRCDWPCDDGRRGRSARSGAARKNHREFKNAGRLRCSLPEKMEFTGSPFTPPPASLNIWKRTRCTARGISVLRRLRWFPPARLFIRRHISLATESNSPSACNLQT